jgi:hypothetical protein
MVGVWFLIIGVFNILVLWILLNYMDDDAIYDLVAGKVCGGLPPAHIAGLLGVSPKVFQLWLLNGQGGVLAPDDSLHEPEFYIKVYGVFAKAKAEFTSESIASLLDVADEKTRSSNLKWLLERTDTGNFGSTSRPVNVLVNRKGDGVELLDEVDIFKKMISDNSLDDKDIKFLEGLDAESVDGEFEEKREDK